MALRFERLRQPYTLRRLLVLKQRDRSASYRSTSAAFSSRNFRSPSSG